MAVSRCNSDRLYLTQPKQQKEIPMTIPEEIKRIPQEGKIKTINGTYYPIKDSINPDEMDDLYYAFHEIKPTTSVELGLAHGISAVALSQAMQVVSKGQLNHVHHAIDPYQEKWDNIGAQAPGVYGYDKHFLFHHKFPEEVLPQMSKAQFAFIDASHLFDLTMLDFVLIDKKLDVGGVIAFHDCWMPSLRKVIRYILANRDYEPWMPQEVGESDTFRITPMQRAKDLLAAMLKLIPGHAKIFSQDLLLPWHNIAHRSLIFLKKKGEDTRDCRLHMPF